MLERASSTILEKGQFFCQRKQNVAQTGSMLVNCHITVARACQPPPGVDRKFSPEKMFLWDPFFVWPKSVRFGHGFKRNFDRKLICRFVLRGVLLFQVHLSTLNRMPGIYSKFLTPRFPRWVLCLSALEIVYNWKNVTPKNDKNGRWSSYRNSFQNHVQILAFLAAQKGNHTRAFCRPHVATH